MPAALSVRPPRRERCPGWELSEAFDINDAGQILVQGERKGTGERGVLIATPVPEPAALALMLAGLGVVGIAARRGAPPAGRA